MSRSKWKGPFVDPNILNLNLSKREILVWSRRSTVLNSFVGKNFLVHNGLGFKKLTIDRERVGFKFGSFAGTRKFTKHSRKK